MSAWDAFAMWVESIPPSVLQLSSVAVASAALGVAYVALRATRRAPIETEARRHYTALVRERAKEWKKALPPRPSRMELPRGHLGKLRREGLSRDELFNDFMAHHVPASLDELEDLWREAIDLERTYCNLADGLAPRIARYVSERAGLSEPPTITRFEWDGSEVEDEDELAVDVYGSGLVDLMFSEILANRIQADFANHEHPGWNYPYNWERSSSHARAGWTDKELPSDLVYDYNSPNSRLILATVSREKQRDVTRIFNPEFLKDLRAEFSTDRVALLEIHERLGRVLSRLDRDFDYLSVVPLLPGTGGRFIADSLSDSSRPARLRRLLTRLTKRTPASPKQDSAGEEIAG